MTDTTFSAAANASPQGASPVSNASPDEASSHPHETTLHVHNIGQVERWFALAGGGILTVYGLSKRSLPGALISLAGGAMLFRGATGHWPCAGMTDMAPFDTTHSASASVAHNQGLKIVRSVTLDCPREEVYRFWRNLENLPSFMGHLNSVQDLGNGRSHWEVRAPAGQTVGWDAEIINEVENELLAWKSLEGADINNAGSVAFKDARDGHGTEVTVTLNYEPPVGKFTAGLARLFGEEPQIQLEDDLRRFKQMMESETRPL